MRRPRRAYVDHTEDYDRVIDMLEMSVDTEIDLDAIYFDQYVRDNWSWQGLAASTNTAYAAQSIPRKQ